MRKFFSLSLLFLLGSAAIWGYKLLDTPVVVDYMTAPAELGTLRTTVTATGTVNAVTSVEVGSQLSGQIYELLVDYNDSVLAGQPMARLDPQSYEASVSGARAALKVAGATVLVQQAVIERARGAVDSANAHRSVLEARITGAKATVEEAQLSLRRNVTLRKTLSSGVTEEALDQARARLARAQANLQAAEGELRVQAQTIIMAYADLRKAEAELQNAQARIPEREATLALAEVTLKRTIIRAPIDGIVIDRGVSMGQTVAASLEAPKLFTVAQDLHRMEVHAHIDEADIGKIRVGQNVTFTVDAFPDTSFGGKVEMLRKSPQAVQNVVTYTVVVSTINPDLLMLPGMTATVEILVTESSEVLKIPAAALRYTPASADAQTSIQKSRDEPPAGKGRPALVWKRSPDNTVHAVAVRIGESDGETSILTAGAIESGDELIVNEILTKDDHRLFGLRLGF